MASGSSKSHTVLLPGRPTHPPSSPDDSSSSLLVPLPAAPLRIALYTGSSALAMRRRRRRFWAAEARNRAAVMSVASKSTWLSRPAVSSAMLVSGGRLPSGRRTTWKREGGWMDR